MCSICVTNCVITDVVYLCKEHMPIRHLVKIRPLLTPSQLTECDFCPNSTSTKSIYTDNEFVICRRHPEIDFLAQVLGKKTRRPLEMNAKPKCCGKIKHGCCEGCGKILTEGESYELPFAEKTFKDAPRGDKSHYYELQKIGNEIERVLGITNVFSPRVMTI